ncbi:hypothetical protein [uncultured Lacinutrix sp.]|uniref:hypothetical protein n=1 Tax=uncultured Lacinutrix sp. TaxID=574032 RepID=UPI002626DEB3|nr:hypothetical protein [uncultured Lacinutrix sp.]
MKPTVDLIQLAGIGASLVIDASQKTTVDLIQIAGIINGKGTHLTLVNAHRKPTVDLIQISGVCKGNITLEFVEK